MTSSSSATFHCSYQTQREPGSSTFLPLRSTTGATWFESSLGISRAHTCALETPGTLRVVARNQTSLSETSSDASRNNALSCPASATQRSSRLFSLAPPAENWARMCRARLLRSSISPPTLPRVKRLLEPSSPTTMPRGSGGTRLPRPQLPTSSRKRKRVARGSRRSSRLI